MPLTVAIIGNPNTGKSTLFNSLTGLQARVGNFPGVTVEKKIGRIRGASDEIDLVDLPGTYSLTAYSPEEIIARDYIIEEKPDVVINVVDATNLAVAKRYGLRAKDLAVLRNGAHLLKAASQDLVGELLQALTPSPAQSLKRRRHVFVES